jgi:hypothetical protein
MDIKKKKLNLIKAIMDTHDIQVLDTIEAILGMKSTTPPISESMQDLQDLLPSKNTNLPADLNDIQGDIDEVFNP